MSPSIVVDLYHDVNARLRRALDGLDEQALNWVPGPQMNAIGGLAVHLLSSERRNLLRAVGVVADKDERDLQTHVAGMDALLREISNLDAQLSAFEQQAASGELVPEVTHPNHGPRSPIVLLLETYGHLREHLAHLELTRQLWEHREGTRTGAADG